MKIVMTAMTISYLYAVYARLRKRKLKERMQIPQYSTMTITSTMHPAEWHYIRHLDALRLQRHNTMIKYIYLYPCFFELRQWQKSSLLPVAVKPMKPSVGRPPKWRSVGLKIVLWNLSLYRKLSLFSADIDICGKQRDDLKRIQIKCTTVDLNSNRSAKLGSFQKYNQ